ncbi:MAG: universal stress protein [Cyanobacteria bacterium P01_D01_bin.123]
MTVKRLGHNSFHGDSGNIAATKCNVAFASAFKRLFCQEFEWCESVNRGEPSLCLRLPFSDWCYVKGETAFSGRGGMFERVLVATDFEDGLYRFGLCLQSFRESGVQQLGFVHAIPWKGNQVGGLPPSMEAEMGEATAYIKRYLQADASAELAPDIIVQVGKPSEVIRQAIDSFKPDVMVLGMPSRSLLAEKVFGSTTIGLIPQLEVPVLIVRPPMASALTEAELNLRCRDLFNYLLLPCDLENVTQTLLAKVAEALQKGDGRQTDRLLLLHVMETTASRRFVTADADAQLSSAQEKLAALGAELTERIPASVAVDTEVRVGIPVKEILSAAQDYDITAIATTSRNTGRIWEWTVPSVAGELLRRSWHSVLFFPASD